VEEGVRGWLRRCKMLRVSGDGGSVFSISRVVDGVELRGVCIGCVRCSMYFTEEVNVDDGRFETVVLEQCTDQEP